MKVIVDTSVLIDYLRRKDREKSMFATLRGNVEVIISFISVTELYSGKSSQGTEGRKFIEEITAGIEVVYVDLNRSRQAGELRRNYQLSLGDCFIAQLATSYNLPIATLDKKAFSRVPGLKFFSVETKRKSN